MTPRAGSACPPAASAVNPIYSVGPLTRPIRLYIVIPAKAGNQSQFLLDSRFRGNGEIGSDQWLTGAIESLRPTAGLRIARWRHPVGHAKPPPKR